MAHFSGRYTVLGHYLSQTGQEYDENVKHAVQVRTARFIFNELSAQLNTGRTGMNVDERLIHHGI